MPFQNTFSGPTALGRGARPRVENCTTPYRTLNLSQPLPELYRAHGRNSSIQLRQSICDLSEDKVEADTLRIYQMSTRDELVSTSAELDRELDPTTMSVRILNASLLPLPNHISTSTPSIDPTFDLGQS